jgi:mannose-6-phosphate isomerase-like protein (cupin superfamily)
MIKAHDLLTAVDARTPMLITASTTEADEAASRATLGSMNNCGVGIQRYKGVPPWEIHRDSDELLYVLDGEMELTVVGDDGPETVEMSGGMIVVVPKARWHRPVAKTMVTLFSATPYTNSDVAFGDTPPS